VKCARQKGVGSVSPSCVDDDVKQVQNCWDPTLFVHGGRPGFGVTAHTE
jgi:hypothetical protein